MKSKVFTVLVSVAILLVGAGLSYANGVSVPEPTTLTLLIAGAAGLVRTGLIRRRKK